MPVAIICPSPLTYARQRPITTTASHSSLYDMLAISSRYQYGPFLFFVVVDVTSNYLTTDGLKKLSLLPEAPLRPEARGICHICHMVNPALIVTCNQLNRFTARRYAIARCMLWPCVRLCLCLSVCLSVSVTSRCCAKTAKFRITQTKPHDRPGTHSFLVPKILGKFHRGSPPARAW